MVKPVKEWLKKECPICGKTFDYLSNYTPVTCGKFNCLREASERGLLTKEKI